MPGVALQFVSSVEKNKSDEVAILSHSTLLGKKKTA